MYLRHTTIRKDGKTHTCWRLVRSVRQGSEVRQETFILCRSQDRRVKEKAMHDRFVARIEQALQKLGRRLEKARKPVDVRRLERQVGRLLGRNSRAAGAFKIVFEDAPQTGSGLRLKWERIAAWSEWSGISEGCYLLRSNIPDWSAEELWRTYIQLTQAEAAFRIHKGDLSIRPIWHQKEDRVRAHILVCFPAYVLCKMLEQWQSRAGGARQNVVPTFRRFWPIRAQNPCFLDLLRKLG